MKEIVIKAEGLTKNYGEREAVKGIDFTVRGKECFGFLGPNGAGKTTIINMTLCFTPKTSGTLKVFDMSVDNNPREIKARTGVVPQEDNLDTDLTVFENLMVYARYYGVPRKTAFKRAEELLNFMQLLDRKNDKLSVLSGGMKRRLLIARALVNDPDLLILDEPTTGLDPQARHLIWQKLRGLKKIGVTMILTTHYMEEAAQLCDRLVIMDMGKILTEGDPKKLIHEHIGSDVLEIRVDGVNLDDLYNKLDEFKLTHEKAGDTVLVFSNSSEIPVSKIIDTKKDIFVHRAASLEDVFLRLTGRELRD
ncbi:MAG: ATP-binding cassette domain-containing protein [Thermodesulfobacteriota bacterium]